VLEIADMPSFARLRERRLSCSYPGSYRESLTSDCAGQYALANGAHIIRESAAVVLIVLGGVDGDADIAHDLMVADGPPLLSFSRR
jgi:hypothetical protein